MKDNNWDLISGQDAHDIEVLNYANQVNVIEALFKLLMFHHKSQDGTCESHPNHAALCELHRTGTLFLLADPGCYRTLNVDVYRGGSIVYTPPPWEAVNDLMTGFVSDLNLRWMLSTPIQVAAFCLWRLNWIHPFKNGNGRSARAFSYACLCLKYGFMLPGSPTVIDLIMADGDPYQDALQAADDTLAATGSVDLQVLESYLESLLSRQLSSF